MAKSNVTTKMDDMEGKKVNERENSTNDENNEIQYESQEMNGEKY